MSELLHMGGYGAYVWSAYGAAAVILIVNALLPLTQRRRILRNLLNLTRIRNQE